MYICVGDPKKEEVCVSCLQYCSGENRLLSDFIFTLCFGFVWFICLGLYYLGLGLSCLVWYGVLIALIVSDIV